MAATEIRAPVSPGTSPSDRKATQEVTLPVTGMTCASCVRRIEKALGKVAGVTEASVNLATEKARVAFDPSGASLNDLTRAIERAGYGVGPMGDLPPEA